VDVPLTDGFVTEAELAELRGGVVALLRTSVTLDLDAPREAAQRTQIDLNVFIRNEIEGHSFPTGSTNIRQAWLQVTATDAEGNVLYRTGDLDDNGDLRDYFSELDRYGDADLVTFHSSFVDSNGVPELLSWRAAEHFTGAIPSLHDRAVTLFSPTDGAAPGPLRIDARVRFRTHPPHLLRRLGLMGLVEKLEVIDVDEQSVVVDITE
jgi:hypothetical protein